MLCAAVTGLSEEQSLGGGLMGGCQRGMLLLQELQSEPHEGQEEVPNLDPPEQASH